ncbi:MAG: OmpA family protein [Edaphocola sp.]
MKLNRIALVALLCAFTLVACNPQKRLAKKKKAYMEATYNDIKKTVSEAEVTILMDTVKVLFPENLLFAIGSHEIKNENYPPMERLADALNRRTNTFILVNGYTDNTGGEKVNEYLSANRATAALNLLKSFKVDSARMDKWGHGMANPIADNNTEEGRRKNRRVEFIITYKIKPE